MKTKKEPAYIYGKHALSEALKRVPHAVKHVYFVEKGNESLLKEVQEQDITFDRCDEDHLPKGADKDAVHQGVIARIAPHRILTDYKTFIDTLEVTDQTGLVVLNELHDPHNVGAIIRNAVAFGISGILIPEYRQAPITGAVVKVSAGMAFAVPLVSIGNVNQALRDLKDKGFWIYGLTREGDSKLTEEQFTKASVFVFGNEGKGIREKTEDLCDFRLSIPIEKNVESLNVASSAAITFYAWKNQQ